MGGPSAVPCSLRCLVFSSQCRGKHFHQCTESSVLWGWGAGVPCIPLCPAGHLAGHRLWCPLGITASICPGPSTSRADRKPQLRERQPTQGHVQGQVGREEQSSLRPNSKTKVLTPGSTALALSRGEEHGPDSMRAGARKHLPSQHPETCPAFSTHIMAFNGVCWEDGQTDGHVPGTHPA